MLKPYLPNTPKTTPSQQQHKQRVRPAVRHLLHSFIFTIIHAFFSIYIRFRQAYHAVIDQLFAVLYYHHRTPELIKRDVKDLTKVPKHLSVILKLAPEGGRKDGYESLLHDTCEIAAWASSAGIPMLSVYEKTGSSYHYSRVPDIS